MGSAATIELDRLLAPITDDNPAGDDLRADPSAVSPYYTVKDARKAARAKERNLGIDDVEMPDTRADWRPVLDTSTDLLATRSKDIELVAWLIEALVRLKGFAGLRDGFRLALGLVEQYWDTFHPHEDDILDRVAAFSGLNGQDAEGTLIFPIRNVPITEGRSVGPFASWHYQQAVTLQQVADPEARERRISAGAVTLETIDKASLEADPGFIRNTYDDLLECREVYAQLTARLDELCGAAAAPPSSNIRKELDACLEAVQYVGRNVIVDDEPDAAEQGDVAPGDAVTPDAGVAVAGKITSREQAFKQLTQLADFFRRTEPHSPLSYAIDRVVRWGRMPLPELLDEMVIEDDARRNLFWLAGIRSPGSSEE
ncbi:MAG: type VI secretion system protein TssA [Gammaproteobacteria bacterium]|nr:type VI secretion system protein TssA [Gammaproteobacteria bacterium]MCB1924611.1 type VI secretion system protein TssA [Gammaproteobacteria bacterium]